MDTLSPVRLSPPDPESGVEQFQSKIKKANKLNTMPKSASVILLLLLFFGSRHTQAVITFTGWLDNSCRNTPSMADLILPENVCVGVDGGQSLQSIEASGLQDTNLEGGDHIKLYSDGQCQVYKSTVKHSRFCINIRYSSLMYVPGSLAEAGGNGSLDMVSRCVNLPSWLRRDAIAVQIADCVL